MRQRVRGRPHTRHGEKYVTVIIDLTPVRDGTGSARLLDMVAGRFKQVFKTWLAQRSKAWQAGIEVVAMDRSPASKPRPSKNCPTRSR